MTYTITLTGTGATISDTINGAGRVNFTVPVGMWTVRVRAEESGSLRAFGETSVHVTAAQTANVNVAMGIMFEAANAGELQDAITRAGSLQVPIPIMLTGNITLLSQIAVSGDANVTLISDTNVTISRGAHTGVMFGISAGSTLNLGRPGMSGAITINGSSSSQSTAQIIQIDPGSTLTMHPHVTLTGNRGDTISGGGVVVYGTFIMHGGTIRGNTQAIMGNGGGVAVQMGGAFTMHDGAISGNTVADTGIGGGVFVAATAAFTMRGGVISNNTTTNGGGGGVAVSGGTFSMYGGTINSNTAQGGAGASGGGVTTSGTSTFTMRGGTISGNTAAVSGGGVNIASLGSFTMTGGFIHGSAEPSGLSNIATQDGDALAHHSNSFDSTIVRWPM